jgi:iron complex outermembrane receptor protein
MKSRTASRWVFVGALGALAVPVAHAAEDAEMEEMVITGSYLKRAVEDSSAPLSVLTSADIEDLGAADVSEIVQAMPWQSGSQVRATTFGGEGADGRNSVNLRNIGHGATLPLVNGRRQVPSWYNPRGEVSVNVNGLVPNSAIERIEVVKDGASALYGSDAIAGVVNFITKRNFEGFEFSYQGTTDEETREGTAHEADMIFGLQGERGGIVLSASFLKRNEITIDDRYDRFGGSSASGTGQPGASGPAPGQVAIWAANGLNPGQPVGAGALPRDPLLSARGNSDIDCNVAAAADGRGGTIGSLLGNAVCAYDFASFFALQAQEELRKFHITGDYEVREGLTAYMEFASNESEFNRDNSLNPNSPTLPIPVTHFGNIEDSARRGIVPLVRLNSTRLVGGTIDSGRPVRTFTDIDRQDNRMLVGLTYDTTFGDRAWSFDLSYTASDHDSATAQVQDTQSAQMELAINGLGGPNCDVIRGTPGEGNLAYAASGGNFNAGRCYFFNPYGNARFNRAGGAQTDLTLVNPNELYQFLLGRVFAEEHFSQRVIDLVASGEVFKLPAGPLGLAVGFQRRRDKAQVLFDAVTNSNNLDFAFGAQDWENSLTVTAAFAEVAIPVFEGLDVNIAARYEEFDEIDTDTFDPKISILWRPIDSLTLRASAGTSFRIASLLQLGGSLTTVANEVDFDGSVAFRASITSGNPGLEPESAENYNVGFSWIPQEGLLEGLQVDMDYYTYTIEDLVTREAPSTILAADNAALRAFITANPGATLQSAIAANAGNRRQVVRSAQGGLLRIFPDFINANSSEISGIDLTTSYSFEAYGDWRVGLQLAYVLDYEVELSSGAKLDAVGQYNDRNPVARPLPEYKLNTSLSYSNGPHRAFLMVEYVPELDYGFDLATDPGSAAARFWRATVTQVHGASTANDFFTRNIHSMLTADLSYTYTFGEVGFLSDSSVTIGVQNITNEEPPWVPVNTGFDATLHDPRGRIWSMKFKASM